MTRQTLRQRGEETLKTLLGSTEQAPGLGHLLTEPVFGGVWNRPGLGLSDRLVCAPSPPWRPARGCGRCGVIPIRLNTDTCPVPVPD